MKVEPLSGREKNLITIGITVSIIALLATYIILPYWDKYNSFKSDFQAKNQIIANLQKENRDTSLNKKRIEEARTTLKELKGRLPDHPANAELLYYINKAAGESSVVLEAVVMNKSDDKKSVNSQSKEITSTPVEITASGQYTGLRQFTQKIQELKRLNRLNSVEIYVDPSNKIFAKLFIDAFTVKTSETDKAGNNDIPAAVLTKTDPFI